MIDLKPAKSIITLSVNDINASIKKQKSSDFIKSNIYPYVTYTKPTLIQRYKQAKSKIIQMNNMNNGGYQPEFGESQNFTYHCTEPYS